ncbi:MAG: LPP20 family lipoprotein [Gammaproteobacteria bacterium]|nr:LPP20 family lipoprotein [Gammaproteobacteria bacterium]
MFSKNVLFILLILSLMSGAHAESCDFLPRAMQPEWTFEAPAIEGFYVGVGLAEAEDLSANEQMERAKQSALSDLSSNIRVSVRSSLSLDIKQKTLSGDEEVEKNVRQLTETITEISLKDVEIDSTWLDRKRCIVWVRVKVSRDIVDEMGRRELNAAKLSQLDFHYEQARNKKSSAEERDMALKQAYVLLDEIDFKVLNGNQSKRYYQRLLDGLGSSLSIKMNAIQEAEKLRQQAESLLLKASSTSDADQRKKYTVDAIAKLKEIIATNPIGERDDVTAGEAALFKIAEVEKARNNGCEAQLQYEIVRDRSRSEDWINKSMQMLDTVSCTRKDHKTRAWRKAFDGIQTSFLCANDLHDEVDDWDKPCENVASFLQSYGALSATKINMNSREVVKLAYQLDSNANAAKENLGGKGRVLVFIAKGKIKHRDNPKNPMGQDHQFTGKIYSFLLDNGDVEFRDTYTGTGGWNPVSEEMTMEVMGLNVAKRWKSRYFEHIKNN